MEITGCEQSHDGTYNFMVRTNSHDKMRGDLIEVLYKAILGKVVSLLMDDKEYLESVINESQVKAMTTLEKENKRLQSEIASIKNTLHYHKIYKPNF